MLRCTYNNAALNIEKLAAEEVKDDEDIIFELIDDMNKG